jgi:hypothetical protein
MIVAVNSNFGGIRLSIEQTLFALENLLFGRENLARFVARTLREIVDLLFEQPEGSA